MSQNESSRFSVNPVVLWRDLKDALAMFWAVVRGRYPAPIKSIVWAVLFLAYFALPLDVIPEAVFLFLGFSDDVLFLVFVINKMRPDIDRYRLSVKEGKGKIKK